MHAASIGFHCPWTYWQLLEQLPSAQQTPQIQRIIHTPLPSLSPHSLSGSPPHKPSLETTLKLNFMLPIFSPFDSFFLSSSLRQRTTTRRKKSAIFHHHFIWRTQNNQPSAFYFFPSQWGFWLSNNAILEGGWLRDRLISSQFPIALCFNDSPNWAICSICRFWWN